MNLERGRPNNGRKQNVVIIHKYKIESDMNAFSKLNFQGSNADIGEKKRVYYHLTRATAVYRDVCRANRKSFEF